MQISNVEQGTDAWRNWRDSGLGASDCATILGISPYQTRYDLWLIRTGRKPAPDLSKNPHVIKGIRQEPLARIVAEKYCGFKLLPVCASEEIENFMLTSFDGYNEENNVVCELKCPHENTFIKVEVERENSAAYKLYYPQVQQQLYVSKAKFAYLIFFLKGEQGQRSKMIPFKIYPDKRFLNDELLPALRGFWFCLANDIPPERDLARDPCVVNKASWSKLASKYKPLKEEHKRIVQQEKEVKLALKPFEKLFIDLMDGNAKADEAGVKASKVDKKSSVDFESALDEVLALLALKNVKISKKALMEKHSKKGSTFHRFALNDQLVTEHKPLVAVSNNNSNYF